MIGNLDTVMDLKLCDRKVQGRETVWSQSAGPWNRLASQYSACKTTSFLHIILRHTCIYIWLPVCMYVSDYLCIRV